MDRMDSLESVLIASVPPLLKGTVYTRMTRSGSRSGAWPYDNIIVWAHLIQRGRWYRED
jgi:hypothetical protein